MADRVGARTDRGLVPSCSGPKRLGQLLRLARQAKGLSQLEFALVLGVSQRHVSFVESGRARPSRKLLLDWLTAAAAPQDLAEAVLACAGLAPWEDHTAIQPTAAILHEPLRLLMSANGPTPILLFTCHWVMVGMNAAGEWLAELVMSRYWDRAGRMSSGLNMIAAMIDEDGLFREMVNAPEAAASLLAQIERESWRIEALAQPLTALRESIQMRYRHIDNGDPGRSRRFIFESPHGALTFYPVTSSYRSARGSGLNGLRIEQWLPGDDHTRRVMSAQSFAR